MPEAPVITIDGPSGSGKGAVSTRLAQSLDWHILDSGAIYRVLALTALNRGLELDDEKALEACAEQLDVRFGGGDARGTQVILEGKDVTEAIRGEDCGNAASIVAAYPGVRKVLLTRQRRFRQAPGLVADGRDMGTVVFPDAEVKIFLKASPEERAKRRYKQLKEQGFSVNLARLSAEIAERDARDEKRKLSPLKPAPDATVIDTTGMEIKQVVEKVLATARIACPGLPSTID